GMKDYVNAFELADEFIPVPNVAEKEPRVGIIFVFLVQKENFGFIIVQTNEFPNITLSKELFHKFGADSPAGSGHQDSFVL
ncbi:hypothetical protein ADUPG1_000966, partial [Aduncisulcus paluster]